MKVERESGEKLENKAMIQPKFYSFYLSPRTNHKANNRWVEKRVENQIVRKSPNGKIGKNKTKSAEEKSN